MSLPRYKEEWKDIVGFEGFYQVSNLGRIKSISRRNKKERIRVFYPAPNGYLRLVLSVNNKRKTISAHRSVAEAFIPNPNNWETVNHKDFNKNNNCSNNLEWLPISLNIRHSCINGRHFKKPINQFDLKGNFIKEWGSAYQVECELGYFATLISRCCRGAQKHHKQYIWRFKNAG